MNKSDLQQKKKLHIQSFQLLIAQLQDQLNETADFFMQSYPDQCKPEHAPLFIQSILQEADEMLDLHRQIPAAKYADCVLFTKLNQDMLDVKFFGFSKLLLWRYDDYGFNSSESVPDMCMRNSHRTLISTLKKRLLLASHCSLHRPTTIGSSSSMDDLYFNHPMRGEFLPTKGQLSHEIHQLIAAMNHNYYQSYPNELSENQLIQAAADGAHPDILRMLISSGAFCINALAQTKTRRATAVFRAAQFGHADCLKVLLQDGKANLEMPNQDDASPLYAASQNGHAQCLQMLIDAKAIVDQPFKDGSMPLLVAAQNGHTECVELLIKAGADVNFGNYKDATPLIMANHNGNTHCSAVITAAIAAANKKLLLQQQQPQPNVMNICFILNTC